LKADAPVLFLRQEHSVLLNSHLPVQEREYLRIGELGCKVFLLIETPHLLSFLFSADDGAGVAIQLELLRILTTAPRPRLRHAVILLFNNGEESLQDASHLYTTQHNETVPSVRGVVNLEACGTSGPELLFQATSVPFVEAYAKVPYPYGTVLANDIFSTGLILSDTDFRQFVQYGGLSGLDIAVVGNSYLYHTRSDITSALQPGMLQHFGESE
jgi:Zn-dependent M28 family amino/carboxypeptidase